MVSTHINLQGQSRHLQPRARKLVNLTFHTGALIDDPERVLEQDAKEARSLRVRSSQELEQKKAGLEKIVANWIQLKNQ